MFTNSQIICHYVDIPEHLKDILHNYLNWSLTLKTVAYFFFVSSGKKMKFKVIIKICLSFIGIPIFTGNIHAFVLVREFIKITLIWWSSSMVSVSSFLFLVIKGGLRGCLSFFEIQPKIALISCMVFMFSAMIRP